MLLVFGVLALAAPAAAQTGPSLMLDPFRTSDQFELNLQGMFQSGSETSNLDALGSPFDYRADVYDLNGRLRVAPVSREGFGMAQPRVGFATHYEQLHSTDPALPDELFDGSVAFGMGVLSAAGWLGGLSVGIGHAGTDFEADGNALYLQGNFVLGKTFSNGDVVGLVLDYDGNRSFLPDWPLPGFQVRKRLDRPSSPPGSTSAPATRTADNLVFEAIAHDPQADPPRLVLALGVPFTEMEWRPIDDLLLEVTFSLPDNFAARVDWTVIGDRQVSGVGLYASLNRTTEAFHWNELPRSDRLFHRMAFVEAGLNWRLHDRFELVIAGGYAFNQEFESGWDTRDSVEVAEIDDAPYARAQARLRF